MNGQRKKRKRLLNINNNGLSSFLESQGWWVQRKALKEVPSFRHHVIHTYIYTHYSYHKIINFKNKHRRT